MDKIETLTPKEAKAKWYAEFKSLKNEEKLSLHSGYNMYTSTLDLRDNLEIQELN